MASRKTAPQPFAATEDSMTEDMTPAEVAASTGHPHP